MKLNIDCIRDVMLEIEKMPYHGVLNINNLIDSLSQKYSVSDIKYSCLKLHEAHLIVAETSDWLDNVRPEVLNIFDITFAGHQFLSDIRSNTVWNKARPAFLELGTTSLSIISNITSSIGLHLLKSKLNLS